MCSSSGRLSFGWDVKSYVVRCVSPLTKWQHSTCRHVAVLRRHWRQQFRPRPPRLDSSCGVVPLQWSLQFDDTRSYSVSVLAVSVRQYGIPKPNPIEYRQYCTTKKITTLYIMQFACDIIQYIYTVFKKNCAKLFWSEICQISTNCRNVWHKNSREDKLMWGALIFQLT